MNVKPPDSLKTRTVIFMKSLYKLLVFPPWKTFNLQQKAAWKIKVTGNYKRNNSILSILSTEEITGGSWHFSVIMEEASPIGWTHGNRLEIQAHSSCGYGGGEKGTCFFLHMEGILINWLNGLRCLLGTKLFC